ncbi:MAG: nitrous oxide reductase accessory protein NosL [Flavobacteriaceae bacterium]|nr:nitrous oxide reductase accessory protein NosL [Flavobacteriaceae bacterium]
MTKKAVVFLFVIFYLEACTVKTKPINYGLEHCRHCEMTIVDQNHAALYLTKKGKQYNFDAVECLIGGLKNTNETQIAQIKVTNYGHPKQLINAHEATYLISEGIKSPMGANLSAFASKQDALKAQQENGGIIYTWQQIKKQISF